jgi:hypothetical protein
VQDRTGTGLYRVGPIAAGTATENDSSLSITVTAPRTATAHPNATIYFANSTVHCFANGTSPHDPVSLHVGTAPVVLRCEEPFPIPPRVFGITVSDGGA